MTMCVYEAIVRASYISPTDRGDSGSIDAVRVWHDHTSDIIRMSVCETLGELASGLHRPTLELLTNLIYDTAEKVSDLMCRYSNTIGADGTSSV